nr:immunoglobulin light chain junction region [Macaca mulatta]MOW58833.1 immunoglobulin light chain junction region [Macaca mulatta]MOW59790.1 immunoglobulin light chain junction region [Macaca mulatta]
DNYCQTWTTVIHDAF